MIKYRKYYIVFMLVLSLSVVGSVAGHEPEKPSGYVHIEETQAMLILGGDWGKGTLHFKAKTHHFKTKGVTLGGAGVHKVSMTGNVYHLDNVSKFAGTYIVGRAGLTVGGGVGGQVLENENGVVLELKTTQEGLALALGAEGLTIKMK